MVSNIINKTITGRVFKFYPADSFKVILGMRRSKQWDYYKDNCPEDYRYYEMLIGKIYLKTNNVQVLSWYYYYGQKELIFHTRSPKKTIRNCMKKRPDKIQFHTGRIFKLKDLHINDNINQDYRKYLESSCN